MITLFFIIKHVIISVPKYVFHCLQLFSLYNKGRIERDLDSHTVNILYQGTMSPQNENGNGL